MWRHTRRVVVLLCVLALLAGASAAFAGKTKKPPVICSDGITYLNQCVATCAGATDCVPTDGGGGGGPQP